MKKNLQNQRWRLNNLYWIKNDKGERIKFKPNWAQNYLLDNLWYLNVILKARQLGITTFFCILYLDETVFKGMDSGLIAHTLVDAVKIFDTKIKYAWDNLPDVIKSKYEVDAESARELRFRLEDQESSIYVGSSLRSGTVQRLHSSELSTVDQKYPAKSEEIKAGAFNTVHKKQIITVESTAKVPEGVFFELCEVAMRNEQKEKAGQKLTEMDWKFFFFPWWKHPEYQLGGDIVLPKELTAYFEKLETEIGVKISQAKRNWYFKKWETQQGAMKSEYPSTPEEAFRAEIEGAYYARQMSKLQEQGHIGNVPWDPLLPVDTWWDIGLAKKKKDAMSIWFTQDYELEIRVIDFFSGTGEGLLYYKKELDKKDYAYGVHNAPHDIMVKEVGTGKTRFEMAAKIGLRFNVIPKSDFSDGIEAVRMILPKCWFDEKNCAVGIKALFAYRRAWDDVLGKPKDRPLENWAADPADAFRMMAVGHKDHLILGNFDPEVEELRKIRSRVKQGGYDPFNPFGT